MKILFPTDYSDNAKNAFQFACNMAVKNDAQIILLHSYEMPFCSNITMDDLAYQLKIAKNAQLEKLKKFVKDFEVHATKLEIDAIDFRYIVETGFPLNVISDVVEVIEFDVIIMGTKGEGNEKSINMGSVTKAVINNIDIPVLAIPADARYKNFTKVMITEDYDKNDEEAINKIQRVVNPFKATLNIVHLAEPKDFGNGERKSNYNNLKNHILRKTPNIDYKVLYGYDKINTLNEFIDKENIDLITMIVRERKVTGGGRKKLVDEVLNNTKIPLLAV